MPTEDVRRTHSYGDKRRKWNDAFVSYMTSIVDHQAYAGMPCTRDDDGKIDWTIPSNRSRGSKNWDGNSRRRQWWENRARKLGFPIEGHWLSRTAKAIHPFGRKPCQTCGRVMELAYVYPNKRTVERINQYLQDGDLVRHAAYLTIEEVAEHLRERLGTGQAVNVLAAVFPKAVGGEHLRDVLDGIHTHYVDQESRMFSPGAMSNAPDRLDGFHTYNLCCRSREDRGRSRSNLVSYSVDRRAFEQWSEGNWAVADLVMAQAGSGRCANCGADGPISADHIGPISLGFAHSPHFAPLCRSCNSAKNNRMSLRDVRYLRDKEDEGASVASWQINALWRRLGEVISSESDALLLSKLLRIQQHHYLMLLHRVWSAGLPDLLLDFLHPEYAYQRISLVGFNPASLTFSSARTQLRQDGYATSRAARMMRIAFDALRAYGAKVHRNVQVVDASLVEAPLRHLDELLAAEARTDPGWRGRLVKAIELDAPAEVRDEQFIEFADLRPDQDSSNRLREVLERVLDVYGEVLSERYERGEAVSWDDFADV